MTTFDLRQIKTASFVLLLFAGAGLVSGCSRKACFAWTAAEGACPSQIEASSFFGDCTDILSVDSEGTFSDDLCCYEVSKSSDEFACASPPGPPNPSTGFVSSVATGPVPGACDPIGVCQTAAGDGCFDCALRTMCDIQLNLCVNSLECGEFSECSNNCPQGDAACVEKCRSSFPEGSKVFQELIDCVVCQECPGSCMMSDFVVPASCQPMNPPGTGGAGGMSGAGGAGGMSGAGGAGGMSGTGGAP